MAPVSTKRPLSETLPRQLSLQVFERKTAEFDFHEVYLYRRHGIGTWLSLCTFDALESVAQVIHVQSLSRHTTISLNKETSPSTSVTMFFLLLTYCLPLVLINHLLKNYYSLRSIPGPILARLTNLYRAYLVYNRSAHENHLRLHKTYGNLVRLGPQCVSVTGSSTFIPQIYGIGKGLVKSDFYACFQNIVNGRRAASLVAMTDESQHAKSKRLIAHAYSLSTLVEYEELVDRTTDVFVQVLEERFASTGSKLDLGRYLQFFAFDVIGELTFSRRLGFIEQGEDVDGIISAIGANFSYFSVLGQMPWLDEALLGKNPLYVKYFRKSVSSPILLFAQGLLKERLRDLEDGGKDEMAGQVDKPDFLSRFLKIRKEEPSEETLTDSQILSNLFVSVGTKGLIGS